MKRKWVAICREKEHYKGISWNTEGRTWMKIFRYRYFEHKGGTLIHGNKGAHMRRQWRMRNKGHLRSEAGQAWGSDDEQESEEIKRVIMAWKPRKERISRAGWSMCWMFQRGLTKRGMKSIFLMIKPDEHVKFHLLLKIVVVKACKESG